MANFTPRLTAPSTSNSYYFSGNPFYPTYGMPNCTCYAFGRFWEISGQYPRLCTMDAHSWYGYNDGYARGKTPRLGAIACYYNYYTPYEGGHVCVVEQIKSDTHIVVSNSGWGGDFFYLTDVYKTSTGAWQYNSARIFQGFIYNPAVASGAVANEAVAFSKFISTALGQVGKTNTWVCSKVGIDRSQPWCGAFIAACAKEAGIAGKVISTGWTTTAQMCGDGVTYKGQFYKGPYQGVVTKPQVGDICGTMNVGGYVVGTYGCSHVGIVTKVNSDSFEFTSGNSTSGSNESTLVTTRTYKFSDTAVFGYYRPKWSEVGGTTDAIASNGYTAIGGAPLYEFENTKDDATVREVCYMKDAEPSIKLSDMKLSVVNYTRIVGPLSEVLGVSGSSSDYGDGSVDFSGIGNANAKTIGEYLVSKGLNAAQAVGFLANIEHESGYSPSAVNPDSGASGICQWLGGRYTAMVNKCGANWKSNLSGQLDYLWYELEHSENATLKKLQSQITSNSEAMAMEAARIVCNSFERPGDGYDSARAATAKTLWSKIKITTTTVTLTGSDNETKIWNFLISKGYSRAATAAVMGNMYWESGFNPKSYTANDSGYGPGGGLCGWLACYFGNMWEKSLEEQLNFVVNTFIPTQNKQYGYLTLQQFKSGTDASFLAGYFDDYIERSSGAFRSKRQATALEILKRH